MPQEQYNKIWQDITSTRPDSYQKLDVILKNLAPPTVPVIDILKKLAGLFTACFNLKVLPPSAPDMTKVRSLCACGQISFKSDAQSTFPAKPTDMQPPVIAPVLVQAEYYDEDLTEFRMSIRSSDGKKIAPQMMALIKFYVNPE
jgi:hypothetical protein